MDKLTKAQAELLRLLAIDPRDGITDRRVALKLRGLGLVECDKGPVNARIAEYVWSITPAGRSALASQKKGDGRG